MKLSALVFAAAAAVVATAQSATTTVSVDLRGAVPLSTSPPGGIPPDFASLSIEVPTAIHYLTLPDGSVRTSFVALMRLLRDASGSSIGPNVRVGGSSVETSAYVPPGEPLPPGITYRVTAADFAAYALAVPAFNGSLTAGLSFANASAAALAGGHAGALLRALTAAGCAPTLEAFEVGNEVS